MVVMVHLRRGDLRGEFVHEHGTTQKEEKGMRWHRDVFTRQT